MNAMKEDLKASPAPVPAAVLATDARRRWLLVGAGAVAGLAGAGLAAWRLNLAPARVDVADDLWSASFEGVDGKPLRMAELRGQPLLLNFWATWCPPCVKEMPELDRFHQAFGPQGWQVVGLAIDGLAPVREFLAKVKVGFPIGLAGLSGTELVRSLGNPEGALPFTVLIGADGRVQQRKRGETHFDELAGWVRQA